jgi:hypothetical protein
VDGANSYEIAYVNKKPQPEEDVLRLNQTQKVNNKRRAEEVGYTPNYYNHPITLF